jgi:hypothetical protein
VQRKLRLFFYSVCWFIVSLCLGCRSGPAYVNGSAYRSIERDADRNSADLAITGAGIAARAERIDTQAERVAAELDGLGAAISRSTLGDPEKGALLRQVATAQDEAAALRGEAGRLREDARQLNAQLEGQRTISAALAAEHDRLAAEAAAQEAKRHKAAARLRLAITIILIVTIIGYVTLREFRLLRVFR